LQNAYFILKLCFVGGLILYHFQCHVIYKQLKNDVIKYTSFKLRLWNEVATIFLVAIVFLIILRSNTGFIWGMLGLIIFSATLMLAIQIYKKSREKKNIEENKDEKIKDQE
jgi:protoporphyrinogen IX oxidase